MRPNGLNQIRLIACHSFKELVRKKDFYVFLFLLLALLVFFFNESFFGVENTSRYLKDLGFSLILIFSLVIAVTFSSRQIPSELETKTIYPLLSKPVSRDQFVLGKFAGGLFLSIASFTVFYAVYLVVIFTKGEGASPVLLIQAYLLSVYLIAFLSSIAIFFSMFLSVSANVTITFLLYFLIIWYNGTLKDLLLSPQLNLSFFYSFLYYILPHFEFYDIKTRIIHLWEPLPLWVLGYVTIYTLLYVSLLMGLSCLTFRKKSL